MSALQTKLVLTDDKTVTSLPYFHEIEKQIQMLYNAGVLQNFTGNCIGATDMFSVLLHQIGIESTIVEVQATVKFEEIGKTYFSLIGFDNQSYKGQIDTHTVIITKTDVPLLIDLSISNRLPKTRPFIIEKLDTDDNNILGEFKIPNGTITYQPKKTLRLPDLHQKTILQRLAEDKETKSKIKLISIVVIALICMSLINFTLNITTIILKLMYP